MIETNALRIADAHEWLGTGVAASEYLYCHQTTVSRTVKQVQITQAKLITIGAKDLLEAERKIHQTLRFRQGQHLRLHLYRWTNELIHREITVNWEANPIHISATKAPGIYLLEKRIIDAICAPYPLIANISELKFAVVPLYTSFLQLLSKFDAAIAREKNLSEADIASLTKLGKLDDVPIEASACSYRMDSEIFASTDPSKRRIAQEQRY